jgi:hypothetical protein
VNVLNVFEAKLDSRFAGDRQEVEHSAGRATSRGNGRHGVLQRVAVDHRTGCGSLVHEADCESTTLLRGRNFRRIGRWNVVDARWRKSEELRRCGHGVRRVLACAGPEAGARGTLKSVQVLVAQAAGCMQAHRFEDFLNRHVAIAPMPRDHRSAVEHEARNI